MARAKNDRATPSALRETGRLAAWVVGLSGCLAVVAGALAEHRAGSLAVQTFVAEWGVGRLGVAWSDPLAAPPSLRHVGARIGRGLALGLSAAIVTLGLAAATHAVSLATPLPPLSSFAPSLVIVALTAIRDELVLRGLVLRAFEHTTSPTTRLAICGLVAMAARFDQLDSGNVTFGVATATTLLTAGLVGVALATLWLRERGAFMAWGAHVAFTLTTTTGILGASWTPTAWGGGPLGFDASVAVLAGLTLVASVAVSAWVRVDARTR